MRFFEDIEIGTRVEFGGYTFTTDNIKAFAAQFDPQRYHLDEEAGRASVFGGLAASGWHTASACMKTMVTSMERERDAALARGEDAPIGGPSPGFTNMKWLRPVLAGDTVSYASDVTGKRISESRPQWGLIFKLVTGTNQRGERVFSFEGSAFMPRREHPAQG